jgi:hypothetical protein
MARFWERNVPASRTSEEFIEVDRTEVGQSWLPLLGYFLAAILVAIIVVFGARAIYHAAHKKNTSATQINPTPPPQISSGSQSTSTDQNKQGNNTPPTPSPSPTSLPNNGPGDVIALFVGTSLVATGLHYIVALRRNN